MSIKSVLKMGNQYLAKPSLPYYNFGSKELENILSDMKDTMNDKEGVGIAAPQIGYPYRIIMFGFQKNERYPNQNPIPFTVLINPVIQNISSKIEQGWEGCLSVPGLRGLVSRYDAIEYQAFDLNGKKVKNSANGFHARIIQHECDHLDGILFPQRMDDMRLFGFEDELQI